MPRLRSFRFQLLITVNAVIGVPLFGFLVLDYYREVADRVAERHIALTEEATTLLPAAVRLHPYGPNAVQQYVDAICGRMQDTSSPGHHIAVDIGGDVTQATAHNRSSMGIFRAMQLASRSPTHRATIGDAELVVGVDRLENATAYISEYVADIQAAVRTEALRRLARIAVLMAVVAAAVNIAFFHLAAKPLKKLVGTMEAIARGHLGIQADRFHTREFDYLAGAINAMSTSLATSDRERREQMAKARRIQTHLLPTTPSAPGLQIAHLCQPAVDVTGDYYDLIRLKDGTWILCVADVTGHGVPAAMSAVMLKTLLLYATEHSTDLGRILAVINRRFAELSLTEDFASMFLARWNPENGRLEYGSAGHEAALFLSADGTLRPLPSTGWLLAVQEDLAWETDTIQVSPGDRLLIVTDGVVEADNGRGEAFGRQRLAEEFARTRQNSIIDTAAHIRNAVALHCEDRQPRDDVTAVVVEFVGQTIELRETHASATVS